MSRALLTCSRVNAHIPHVGCSKNAPRCSIRTFEASRALAVPARLGSSHLNADDEGADLDLRRENLTVLETNIDDLSPQVIAYTMEELLLAGGIDVWAIPMQMKKGRLGTMLGVLCHNSHVKHLTRIILQETTSLGVRVQSCERVSMLRDLETATTSGGLPVCVKVGRLDGKIANVQAEYEDCAKIARAHGIPLKQVLRQALDAYFASNQE